jgi:ADP-heptose:LPS heptosyltransferase
MTAGSGGRILVVKLGALGDFVMALGPCAAIRARHPRARATLLTGAVCAELARAAPYFDEVWVDPRPAPWQVGAWTGLARRLREARFEWVYDLQTSQRSGWYFRLLGRPRPAWSGIVRGCSHPHANPRRRDMHTLDRQRDQLAFAGIADVPAPDLSWAKADIGRLALAPPFAVIAPGSAPHRPEKRWPAPRYAELARAIARRGVRPVLVGATGEAAALAAIAAACPDASNLGGRTTLLELVSIMREAAFTVGNDSGPMHLAAVAGCPAVVLFSGASDPARTAPRGPAVRIVRRDRLGDLTAAEVLREVELLVRNPLTTTGS